MNDPREDGDEMVGRFHRNVYIGARGWGKSEMLPYPKGSWSYVGTKIEESPPKPFNLKNYL